MDVFSKYKAILLSPRFHQGLLIFLLQALQHYGIIDSFIANGISGLFGMSIIVGTVDRANTTVVQSQQPDNQ